MRRWSELTELTKVALVGWIGVVRGKFFDCLMANFGDDFIKAHYKSNTGIVELRMDKFKSA